MVRRRDRAATCAALLAAAQRRFAHEGYDAVSVRDVAGDVGVDAALVFRYFGSKAGLLREATSPAPTENRAGDALPARLLHAVLPDEGRPAGEEQLQLQRQMRDGYVASLAELAAEPQRDLRAELVERFCWASRCSARSWARPPSRRRRRRRSSPSSTPR
jgi:AcrR family transcriptional regulator